METYGYNQIIGSSQAPYINSLANANALLTNYHSIGHPSEPNYLELFSGSTQGETGDELPADLPHGQPLHGARRGEAVVRGDHGRDSPLRATRAAQRANTPVATLLGPTSATSRAR